MPTTAPEPRHFTVTLTMTIEYAATYTARELREALDLPGDADLSAYTAPGGRTFDTSRLTAADPNLDTLREELEDDERGYVHQSVITIDTDA